MEDYVLSKNDEMAVEFIKKSAEDRTLVDVDGEWLKQYQMRCLIEPTAFLPDVVINAYIICIRSQEHLRDREDGKVFLEVTFMSTMFMEAGKQLLKSANEDEISAFRLKLASILALWKANVADLEENIALKRIMRHLMILPESVIVENDHQGLETPEATKCATVTPKCPRSPWQKEERTLRVISVIPYRLRFSLRELQDSLKLKEPMPTTLFNMGLRMVACSRQQQQLRDSANLTDSFIDLTFSSSAKASCIVDELHVNQMWLQEMRRWLSLPATLAASVTYHVGLNLLGGFWQSDDTQRHVTGMPVLESKFAKR
ncbi:hypothetical protein PR202_gb17180 [Eleusine coracana subsp. coracana]|uniref:PGG domain-containing protein n=1 Tax=Eleusine coracana subsp. coracana TaxID=191504 RepID=A0AAV5F3U4_ELECO|nr:hypothetical protein PR202_gb17180 [Eleusine coracana subsp. coracana]